MPMHTSRGVRTHPLSLLCSDALGCPGDFSDDSCVVGWSCPGLICSSRFSQQTAWHVPQLPASARGLSAQGTRRRASFRSPNCCGGCFVSESLYGMCGRDWVLSVCVGCLSMTVLRLLSLGGGVRAFRTHRFVPWLEPWVVPVEWVVPPCGPHL